MSDEFVYATLALVAAYFFVWWAAPLRLAAGREPIAHRVLSARLVHTARELDIRFYVVPDLGLDYAFSCWLWFERAVLIDRAFFNFAPGQVVEFVLAHELGHHHHGHPLQKLLIRALFLQRLRPFLAYLQWTEEEANRYAEHFTGHPRSIVWPTDVKKSAPGGSGQTEEKS